MIALDICLKPLNSEFAHEVAGMSTWSDSIYEEAEFLQKSFSTFGLLVFRRQSINEAELIASSSIFGELGIILRSDWSSFINLEIARVSNLQDARNVPIGGLGSGELDWHTDQSYMQEPATGAVLHAIKAPENGPKTVLGEPCPRVCEPSRFNITKTQR